jgi:hypothetical protein
MDQYNTDERLNENCLYIGKTVDISFNRICMDCMRQRSASDPEEVNRMKWNTKWTLFYEKKLRFKQIKSMGEIELRYFIYLNKLETCKDVVLYHIKRQSCNSFLIFSVKTSSFVWIWIYGIRTAHTSFYSVFCRTFVRKWTLFIFLWYLLY